MESMDLTSIYTSVIIAFFVIILASAIRILREYERGVIFRLGRLVGSKGPGLILLIPIVDKMVRVSLRTVVMDVSITDDEGDTVAELRGLARVIRSRTPI